MNDTNPPKKNFMEVPRGTIRADVEITAEVREQGYSYFKTRLMDISSEGFRLFHLARFTGERNIFLKIPGMESLEAEIKWHRGDEYGCRFLSPLHPAVFDHVVRYISSKS